MISEKVIEKYSNLRNEKSLAYVRWLMLIATIKGSVTNENDLELSLTPVFQRSRAGRATLQATGLIVG